MFPVDREFAGTVHVMFVAVYEPPEGMSPTVTVWLALDEAPPLNVIVTPVSVSAGLMAIELAVLVVEAVELAALMV